MAISLASATLLTSCTGAEMAPPPTPAAIAAAPAVTLEPYASARRVFWIVDNGSSRRGQASIQRMAAAWPTAELVHLPVHASWLDQVEIYFSILQRGVLTPNDLTDRDTLAERVLAFQNPTQYYCAAIQLEIHPHRLDRLLNRIATHESTPSPPEPPERHNHLFAALTTKQSGQSQGKATP